MINNKEILKKRIELYDNIPGPRIGDYLLYKGNYVRFTHDWGDSLQTGDGGSFYFGDNYISFSGGLNHGVDKNNLILTKKIKDGGVWFFDNDLSGGGRGKDFTMKFRIFKIKDKSKIKDYDILGYDIREERLKITKEKIERINGNGQLYVESIPKLIYLGELNDIALKHIEENTGLVFKKGGGNNYTAQPQTSNEVVTLILTYNFRTQYHNNASNHNTLFLKDCSNTDFNY